MQIDIAALIVSLTGLAALVWSIIQAKRGRKDTIAQQKAANELATREQDWEELTEGKRIAEEDLRAERITTRELRDENNGLRREIRTRDDLIARHRTWDIDAGHRLKDTDIGEPPHLYP
ncbi:hypothetical protein [Arthrobacter burdickii]|uniref:Uncharacterized protein n=1 Tax=Arthrobacter burdickii TaxID=3035920 RepID=A0ABT8K3E5_9MICC|nr:hypothetical protein [Arthrobacter burdickii]MDN4611963.1 hypothetical protein [Arthrobacter burdickii]